jgi:hypothetical protein
MTSYLWKALRKRFSFSRSSKPYRRCHRLQLERLEDRIVPSLTLLSHYTGLDTSINGNSPGEPPDTQGAAGPSGVVEVVNQGIALYNPKGSGSNAQTATLSKFFFTNGGVPPVPVTNSGDSDGQTDCFVLYDPLVQRFIVGDLDFELDTNGNPVNNGGNQLLLAVSKSSNPTSLTTSDWYFYHIKTSESGAAIQDYPGEPGYNADALVVTLNPYDSSGAPLSHTLVNSISMNGLINGTLTYFQTDYNQFLLMRPTTMKDSAPGSPMWFVASQNGGAFNGAANTLDVIKMTNVLSANPTFSPPTTLTVNPYYQAIVPVDPGGKGIDSGTDSRILQSDEANGIIVTSHEVADAAGDANLARWYAIDVSSGTPVLQQQGDVGGGPGTFYDYPGIGINAQGDIGLTYVESGKASGMYESMYITGRSPSDAPGTMETPILVQAGTGNYNFSGFNSARQGDMSRIGVDPNGSFWAFSQWTDNNLSSPNWSTAVADFTVGSPLSILPVSATEGVPLNDVPVATFLDESGAPLGSYSATIDWGDGTVTSGTVVPGDSPGSFLILGSHTYINAGEYTLTVSEFNGTSTLGPVSGPIFVADAPLQGFAQALNTATAGYVSNALVAVFTDTDSTPRSSNNYTATITWNEGYGLTFSSTGAIYHRFGNTFAVYGSSPYTFPSGGLFPVVVVVHDLSGASVTVNSVVSVAHNPAIPPLVPQYQSDNGPVTSQFVTLEDALTNLLNAERLFIVAMTFGTTKEKEGTFGNLVNALLAYETAIFNFDMRLPGA